MFSAIEKQFALLARTRAPMEIVFDRFLTDLLHGAPPRRDRALAFYQLLVLKSLEVIEVKQEEDMGDIRITKGVKYAVRWRYEEFEGEGGREGEGGEVNK